MRRFIFYLTGVFLLLSGCNDNIDNIEALDPDVEKEVVEPLFYSTIYKSEKLYCAFCDMIFFKNRFYVAFRVSENHYPYAPGVKNGYIKIMSSSDAIQWEENLDIHDLDWDLRDPCFVLNTEKDELSLNTGLYSYDSPNPLIKNKRFEFSENNGKLEIKRECLIDIGDYSDYWLWKIYHHKGQYYSVGYCENKPAILFISEDGVTFKKISELPIIGEETALEFIGSRIIAFQRFAGAKERAWVSESEYPYIEWTVTRLNEMIESPESCIVDDNIYVAGRTRYGCSIFKYDKENHQVLPFFNLFADGTHYDKAYPGMIYNNGFIYIVYYACNDYENYPSVYLSRIKVK